MARPTLEQLFGAFFRAAPTTKAQSAANQYAGRSTIANGAETVTVSTTIVTSDAIITYGVQRVDTVGSVGTAICVRTISPGNFFTLGTTDSQVVGVDTIVMWQIWRTG